MAGKRQSVTQAKLTPRREDGTCGKCAGHLLDQGDALGMKCITCGRLAGPPPPPPPPTAEEVRAEVLAGLAKMYEAGDPAEFWKKYILFRDLAAILFTEPKTLQSWFSRGGYKTVIHRNPENGKRSVFVRIEDAKAVILARN